MNRTFDSSGNKLAYHLATPTGRGDDFSGLILCHGFPIGPLDARRSAGTFPELVDRIAHEVGYIGMTFTFRGMWHQHGRLLAAGLDRRPAIGDRPPDVDHGRARGRAARHQHRRVDRDLCRR